MNSEIYCFMASQKHLNSSLNSIAHKLILCLEFKWLLQHVNLSKVSSCLLIMH